MTPVYDLERARFAAALKRIAEQVRAMDARLRLVDTPKLRAIVAEDYQRATHMAELVASSLDLTVRKVAAIVAFDAALDRLNIAIEDLPRPGPKASG